MPLIRRTLYRKKCRREDTAGLSIFLPDVWERDMTFRANLTNDACNILKYINSILCRYAIIAASIYFDIQKTPNALSGGNGYNAPEADM